MNTIETLTFYPNGAVIAFNEEGEQMEDIQITGWMQLYFAHLVELGYNPEEIPEIRMRSNQGDWIEVKPCLTPENTWNYKLGNE